MLKKRLSFFFLVILTSSFSLSNSFLSKFISYHQPFSIDDPLFEAQLFLNKVKILKKLIVKRDNITFKITLQKILAFENFYGELTEDAKVNLTQFIKREYKKEKSEYNLSLRENQFSLLKKSIYTASAIALEIGLVWNLFASSSIQSMNTYNALAKHLTQIVALTNAPIILLLNTWTALDYLKYNTVSNMAKLKSMSDAIKNSYIIQPD